MLTKPELACAIVEGIASVREDEELQDFVVEVQGTEFKCHRLILSACSEFFRGLLRSGMKEAQKQRTKLQGVSMDAFGAILETLYTGCDNLTRDNMLNVWLAADQLQITVVFDNCVDFITNNICNDTVISVWMVASQLMHKHISGLCETFLINNTSLQNWESIYLTANKLGSDLILSHVRDFIKKKYQEIIKSDEFPCLCENDLLEIIKSPDLVVSSEDVVIESVLYWVNCGIQRRSESIAEDFIEDVSSILNIIEHNGNEQDGPGEDMRQLSQDQLIEENNEMCSSRQTYSKEATMNSFALLLSETRLCLVNSVTLDKLYRHPLVVDNKIKTKEMVMDAALYKSIGPQHGQWPKGAIHRRCSDLENVGVMGCPSGGFYALSFYPTYNCFELPKCPYLKTCTSVKLIAFMIDVFAIGDALWNSSLCVLVQNEWREVKRLFGTGWLGVAVEEFIYLINSTSQQIQRFDPRLGNCLLEDLISFPTQDKIEHVCPFDLLILTFCSEVVKGLDETAVHCLDTRSQTWTRLDSLEGSAKHLVSFRKEKQLYILQADGNLWEINHDECKGVNLKSVGVLWLGDYKLYGAICYNDMLYVYGATCINDKLVPQYLFSHIVTIGNQVNCSNIVPAVLKKSIFAKL
ncbi:unnamed protein product [Lymnaea stagnalis]|uniref:BTB domain-containing protein n=1 Tax=Lymnaea stagnalis TaxID=6523 RepID=A0AAV2I4P4_LYMST